MPRMSLLDDGFNVLTTERSNMESSEVAEKSLGDEVIKGSCSESSNIQLLPLLHGSNTI